MLSRDNITREKIERVGYRKPTSEILNKGG